MLADAWAWKLSHPTGYAKRKPRAPRHRGRSGRRTGRRAGAIGRPMAMPMASARPMASRQPRSERVAVPVTG